MNIYLIGYRCTGKTSVGKLVSEQLAWRFIDTDDEIVKCAGKTIKEIVEKQGWEKFRRMESDVIAGLSNTQACIVATGGGIILDPKNVEIMKQSGKLIWLKARLETIEKRLFQDGATETYRPALTQIGTVEEVEETLKGRLSGYDSAKDYSFDTDDKTVDQVCTEIVRMVSIAASRNAEP